MSRNPLPILAWLALAPAAHAAPMQLTHTGRLWRCQAAYTVTGTATSGTRST